ncbi:hypothetical protein [Escherichia coli]|uniref:hypothetical protein n=1 Tax=Escherichia coli TaxID=562 RepID=UPI0021AE3DBC|nr:hypothetical protein [Escherichia coli]UWX44523.1 hypothetical protein N1H45_15545 [Escherichia coli]UXE84310.1 hypothetical protein N1H43_15145 [Escherichia coli]
MSSKLVLVLNCGSSSLKFAIIDAVNGEEYLSGLAECFHLPEARIKWKMDGNKQEAALGAGAAHSEALNLDAVVFTGGIGENAAMVRELSLGKLGVLGFEVDHERNLAARFGKSGFINKEGTRPAVVIPTNEELVIAQDASRLTA